MILSKNYIKIILLFTLIFLFQNSSVIKASDFNITSNFNIYLNSVEDTFVTVEEILEITAQNPDYYIPKDSTQTVSAKKDDMVVKTIEVLDKYNQPKNYSIEEKEDSLEITIKNRSDIKKDKPFFAKIRYKTQEFVNQNGNITNLYLPGLHEDSVFEKVDPTHGLKTKNQYFLSYYIPIDAPKESFIKPKDISRETDGKYNIFRFSQDARVGENGRIQLGNEQYYFFRISQQIPQTDFLTPEQLKKYTGWLSKNILELTLPREFEENNQEVFFTKISPTPSKIKGDEEGNTIAVFELDPTKEEEIVIEGYIKLSKNEKEIQEFTISKYKENIKVLDRLEIYTQADKYWESQNAQIQEMANNLLSQERDKSILDLIRANYYFVIEHLEYSKEKAEGNNERVGALKALQGAQAVCMEYSDLLITILRAQGIPSRAAFGYGNDPLLENLEEQVRHQWVQIWYPNYGWLSLDPTWGETGREYIGGDLDHLLWYTNGSSEQQISELRMYSADSINDQRFESYKTEILPLHKSEVPNLEDLRTISEIMIEYSVENNEEISKIEQTLKTTILGRALIFIIPIAAVVILITTISIIISKLFKPRKINYS
jgi:hypothetical protein